MATKRLDSAQFTKELEQAGLDGLPMTWREATGELVFTEAITDQQRAAITTLRDQHVYLGPVLPPSGNLRDLADGKERVEELRSVEDFRRFLTNLLDYLETKLPADTP